MGGDIYTHRPLQDPKNFIRLIKLHRLDKNGEQDSIRFNISEHPLSDRARSLWGKRLIPKFRALSYSWDAEVATATVFCNDRPFLVTSNCAAALRRIAANPECRSTHLWVDSICIDQASLNERNHQVTLMANIYSVAEEVLIWVGEGTTESDSLIARMNVLRSRDKLLGKLPFDSHQLNEHYVVKHMRADVKETGAVNSEAVDKAFGNAVLDLLSRSWFHRVWTMQEVILARRATVICGASSFPYGCLGYIRVWRNTFTDTQMQRLCSSGIVWKRDAAVIGYQRRLGIHQAGDECSHRFQLWKYDYRWDRSHSLAYGLVTMLGLHCTDLRDYVYGLYAVLTKLGLSLDEPDYSRSPVSILIDLGKAVMLHDRSLELLRYTGLRQNLKGLPSWMLDITSGFMRHISADRAAWVHKWNPDPWLPKPASPLDDDSTTRALFRFDCNKLKISGVFLSTVEDRYDAHSATGMISNSTSKITAANMFAYGCMKFAGKAYGVGEGDSLWGKDSIIAEVVAYDESPSFQDWLGDLPTSKPTDDRAFTDHWKVEKLETLIERLADRCLFWTRDNHFGFGPPGVEVGDLVFVPVGFDMPLIVRQREDGFQLKGPASINEMRPGQDLWPHMDPESLFEIDII